MTAHDGGRRWRRPGAVALVAMAFTACSSDAGRTQRDDPDRIARREAHRVVVEATEFEFDLPGRFRPGPTRFRLRNVGSETHELILGRLQNDAPPLDRLISLPNAGQFVDLSVNDGQHPPRARPGEFAKDAVDIDLEPGTYVYLCMVRDDRRNTSHARLGMMGAFSVR